MLFPIVPFLSAVGMAVSACTMAWYHGLKKEEKQEADRAAAELAKGVYDKCAGQSPPGLKGESSERRLIE